MKKCELCNSVANIFCDSDRAILCWECDGKVHSANFLVAKHSRTLLCQNCQSLTPWACSGAKLGPTISVCDKCVRGGDNSSIVGTSHNEDDENDDHDDEVEIEDDNGDDDNDSEDDDDNQVVPLCFAPVFSIGEQSSGRLNNRKDRK